MAHPVISIEPTPFDELKKRVDEIRQTDLRVTSVNELKELLTPLFKGWQITAPQFEPGLSVFRGRRLTSPPTTLTEMSYPKTNVRQGRANRRDEPVFYASGGREPIFFELELNVGDRVALAHYKTTAKLLVNRIGYTPATFEQLKSKREIPEYGAINVSSYDEGGHLVNDFLSEVFCQRFSPQDEWRYNLTVAVAEKLLSADFLQGLLYPTVPMWGHADNFALKREFADSSLLPTYAEFLEITKVDGAEISSEVLDEARNFTEGGDINWLGHQGQWTLQGQGDELRMEAVDGHWVARDPQGQIVDPE